MTAVRPFQVGFSDAELADLRKRVKTTQFPERETVTDQSQGPQLATLQKLARYWATDYDWRKIEAKLKALPNLVTEIDGLDIHFIHVRRRPCRPALGPPLQLFCGHSCQGECAFLVTP
ncbi:MAG: epoxide hydrolase N-terminal domain-containing protein [Deltaproteobacteria bacterium]|jgi:hypothetical protein|nr:epoxide hydrolase N-terminal domain-containing protein [Deltaproteobacteria bacterium]